MSRKISLIIAAVLMVGGLVSVGYGVERYGASKESLSISDRQAAEANQLESANIERATQLLGFAAENADMANNQRTSMYMFGGLGVVLLVVGAFFLKKKQA